MIVLGAETANREFDWRGVRRAPYSIRAPAEKAVVAAGASAPAAGGFRQNPI